jgi:uncharacterized protein YqjF (DUF2071 family)
MCPTSTRSDPRLSPPRAFLTADWRELAMLNYRVPSAVMEPYLPRGVELDLWEGHAIVSVVGFLFQRTRILGVPAAFHGDFTELNLRFYVQHLADGEVRRGITFIQELVSRRAVAAAARMSYNEPYVVMPIGQTLEHDEPGSPPTRAEFWWGAAEARTGFVAECRSTPTEPTPGSHEEFITVRHWGYTAQRDGGTVEYAVHHPRWRVRSGGTGALSGAIERTFPPAFAEVLREAPASVLTADGSAVAVYFPRRLPESRTTRSG